MSLKSLKKGDLVSLADELGVDSSGVKPDIERRVGEYFDEHPELASSEKYARYYRRSPRKNAGIFISQTSAFTPSKPPPNLKPPVKPEPEPESEEEEEVQEEVEEEEEVVEEEEGEKENEEEEEEEEEEDVDEEAEEEGEEDKKDDEESEEAEDDEYKVSLYDKLLNSLEFYKWEVEDFALEKYFDFLGLNYLLQDTFSQVETVLYLEILLEFVLVCNNVFPLTPIADVARQVEADYSVIKVPNSLKNVYYPVPNTLNLLKVDTLLFLAFWAVFSIGIPLAGSFYFNFTRSSLSTIETFEEEDDEAFLAALDALEEDAEDDEEVEAEDVENESEEEDDDNEEDDDEDEDEDDFYDSSFLAVTSNKRKSLDPFTFALTKVLLTYFVFTKLTTAIVPLTTSDSWFYHYLYNVAQFVVSSSETVYTILGDIPYIGGLVGAAVALYSALY